MSVPAAAFRLLAHEARGLLTRLARVKPLALVESMVPAAGISPMAQTAIDRFLMGGRRQLRSRVADYIGWLRVARGRGVTPQEAQRRMALLRLTFNSVLGQFDLFADALTQRSEHDTGVWLAGLDAVAFDALDLPGHYYVPPPVVCYLDRGVGAAIRRARTRLPGGGENPVAIIRLPRERMVGGGIASSLVHEVGHQAAALLDLVNSLRPVLRALQTTRSNERAAWILWERWLSEIVADFWAISRVGVSSTIGLMSVVSLPRAFVVRVSADDPHPIPWMRVQLSCAMGQALYPHPQWSLLAQMWEAMYPLDRLDAGRRRLFALLRSTMAAFAGVLVNHRPRSLRGRSLVEVLATTERQPTHLAATFRRWQTAPELARTASPTLAFAVLGQAKANGELDPEVESRMLAELLTIWALRNNSNMFATRVHQPRPVGVAQAV
jgi:hypothetical protein